ncbi:TauD-domain-containing protein [Hymenopellis radicata]|nr:TauD-domain-containing protein [Hymenopellis radicata]
MAPSVAELSTPASEPASNGNINNLKRALKPHTDAEGPLYLYYLPYWDNDEKFPPTQLFEHTDPGSRADPAKPHPNVSPYIGTEISGALFAAERKVVIFRDQDFKDLTSERQIEIASYLLWPHPTSGNVKGFPEFHATITLKHNDVFREYLAGDRINKTSTTFFFLLQQPVNGGGDTLFLSVEAYRRLSPEFQKRLEGLKAVHSAVTQAEYSRKANGPVRREPVESEHPVVRQHPVTGEKALYVNQGFTRRIVGYKKEESDYLLNFLFDHIAKGADYQHNRVTVHSAVSDLDNQERRHAVRLTPQVMFLRDK